MAVVTNHRAQMGRYLDANGQPTNDEKTAAINPTTK
jgi:hypothetical protein